MREAEVKAGGVYAVKVSERIAPVRIDGERPEAAYGRRRFFGTNLRTGRRLDFLSAARLRGELESYTLHGKRRWRYVEDHEIDRACRQCGRPISEHGRGV